MVSLADTLTMTSASYDLGLFDDDGTELSKIMEALKKIEVETCDDFRFTFVMSDEVHFENVCDFASGALSVYFDVVKQLAEDMIADKELVKEPPLKKARPTHNVGGRLVFKSLEEYESEKASASKGTPKVLKVVPSQAAVRQRDVAIRSYAKMQENLARGAGDDTSRHLGERTTLHKREEAKRSKAVDAGFLVLKEAGPLSPRFADMFPEGDVGVDPGIQNATDDIILNGVEPQAVINHAAKILSLIHI